MYSYEPPKAQIIRRFQKLGIQRADPSEYVARFGTQLEDTNSLVARAREAGVVEDIVCLFELNIFILLVIKEIYLSLNDYLFF